MRPTLTISNGGERYAVEVQHCNMKTSPSHLNYGTLKHLVTRMLFDSDTDCLFIKLSVAFIHLCPCICMAIQYVRPYWVYFGHTASVFVLSSGVLFLSSYRDLARDGEEKKRVFNEALSA